jgi:hypothetical protein
MYGDRHNDAETEQLKKSIQEKLAKLDFSKREDNPFGSFEEPNIISSLEFDQDQKYLDELMKSKKQISFFDLLSSKE